MVRRYLTPTIDISGMMAGISNLSFPGIVLFYFANSIHFSPQKVTMSITYCIAWCLKFIVTNRLINAYKDICQYRHAGLYSTRYLGDIIL